MKFDKILSFLILICIETQLISADSETLPAVDPRIVGGEEATFNGTKYQASIRLRGGEEVFGKGHICGGSLIYNSTILTAAHCLFYESKDGRSILLRQASEFIVVMGTLNRFVITNETLTYRVKKFIYHRSYDPQTLQNDIALMYLDGEVPSNHLTVEPINLASYQMPVGTTCRINGWGNTFYGDIFPQDQLLTANVSILDPRQCRSSYLDYMKDGMLCAGDWTGQHDACQGDSGGPLVCRGLLVGIVSWGNLCGEPKWPGLYSDVLFYSQWIKTNMIYSSSNTLFINYLLLTVSTLVIKIVAR